LIDVHRRQLIDIRRNNLAGPLHALLLAGGGGLCHSGVSVVEVQLFERGL
jgi:hypothetical protein